MVARSQFRRQEMCGTGARMAVVAAVQVVERGGASGREIAVIFAREPSLIQEFATFEGLASVYLQCLVDRDELQSIFADSLMAIHGVFDGIVIFVEAFDVDDHVGTAGCAVILVVLAACDEHADAVEVFVELEIVAGRHGHERSEYCSDDEDVESGFHDVWVFIGLISFRAGTWLLPEGPPVRSCECFYCERFF